MEDWKNEIDERAIILIDEFKSHCQDVINSSTDDLKFSKSDLFEGWALQKIASLQLVVEKINKVNGGPYIPGLDLTSNN